MGKPPLPGSSCGPAHVSRRWHGKEIMWCEVCLRHVKRALEKSPVSLWGYEKKNRDARRGQKVTCFMETKSENSRDNK